MSVLKLEENITISNVNSIASRLIGAGLTDVKSDVSLEVDLTGLQLLIKANSTDNINVELKLKESSVELLTKTGFSSLIDGFSLRIK